MLTNEVAKVGRLTGVGACLAACAASAAMAQPAIEVRIDNQVIANNSEFTFQPTTVGGSTPLIVVVRNVGNQDLLFVNDPPVFAFGGFGEQFAIIQPPLEAGGKLSPNGSTAFRVDFRPEFVQARIDTRLFVITNATPAAFALTLAGRGSGPNMVVRQSGLTIADGSAFEFAATPLGQSSTATFSIENQGDAPLTLTGDPRVEIVSPSGAAFAVTQLPATTVAAGGQSSFSVRFSPQSLGIATAQLRIACNQNDLRIDGAYDITLRGVATPAANGADDAADPEELADDANPGNEDADAEEQGQDQQELDEVENDSEPIDAEQGEEAQADEDFAGEDGQEEIEDAIGELGGGGGLCGFGAPFALTGCMLSLAATRRTLRRR